MKLLRRLQTGGKNGFTCPRPKVLTFEYAAQNLEDQKLPRQMVALAEGEQPLVQYGIVLFHTSYLSREPRVYPCKFFLAGVNFYRFNAKKLVFSTDFTLKSGVFFTDLMRKIGVFRCKFYSPKILPV